LISDEISGESKQVNQISGQEGRLKPPQPDFARTLAKSAGVFSEFNNAAEFVYNFLVL
jgi:hypothetical protein